MKLELNYTYGEPAKFRGVNAVNDESVCIRGGGGVKGRYRIFLFVEITASWRGKLYQETIFESIPWRKMKNAHRGGSSSAIELIRIYIYTRSGGNRVLLSHLANRWRYNMSCV